MMSRPFEDFMASVNEMTIAKKTSLLFMIMVAGMLCIGSFAHMSINRIKDNFDILYTKRMLPVIKLENLKDIFTVNVLDTLRDIEKNHITFQQGQTIIVLAQELTKREWSEYKESLLIDESDWLVKLARSWGVLDLSLAKSKHVSEELVLIEKIEKKIHMIDSILLKMFNLFRTSQTQEAYATLQSDLYPSVYSVNIDLTQLANLNFEASKRGMKRTQAVYDNTFEWIVVATVGTISLAGLLAVVLLQNIRLLHANLARMVELKTKELQALNYDLEVKIAHEVEQSRQKDEIMFRQSKLASMGEMIGNIAHQWRQPLNALVLIIQSFQMKRLSGATLSDEFIDAQVKEGVKIASSMSQTIDDFRNFFKPNKTPEMFGIEETIKKSVDLVKGYYEKIGITISVVCQSELFVKGYSNEFSQVIMNLLSNAKDALEESSCKDKLIEIVVTKDDKYAHVEVFDNGGGISKEVIERMFEPYFTTKHKALGTGIGLHMSKQIIEKQMRGTISADSCSHMFANSKFYEACASIIISIPFDKKEE